MSETWRRRILYVAGAWNLIGGVSALLDPTQHFAQLYTSKLSLSDPLQLFFYWVVWINVIAWGIGYVLAARFPPSRLPILFAGGTGKLAYFGACLWLFTNGIGTAALLAAGLVDVLLAVAFAQILWLQRVRHESQT